MSRYYAADVKLGSSNTYALSTLVPPREDRRQPLLAVIVVSWFFDDHQLFDRARFVALCLFIPLCITGGVLAGSWRSANSASPVPSVINPAKSEATNARAYG
jgi:hypothetical protein